MKQYFSKVTIWIVAAAISVLPVVSCTKLFDVEPDYAFDENYIFTDVANVKTTLYGVYATLTGDQGYGTRLSLYYTMDDDGMIAQSNATNGHSAIAKYYANNGNTELRFPFNKLYTGIERANICIQRIPAMEKYANGSPGEKSELRRMYGEALTLRAQFYFELIRNWGDLPASFIPSKDQPDLFLPKTDRDEIYDKILEDLQLAITLMPWRTEVPIEERFTKGAAKALRARIALFRGGYSLRRATHTMERKENDYLNYYRIAKEECKGIMERRDQHNLNPSYISVFKEFLDGHKIDPSGEVMFEVGLAGGTSSFDGKIGNYDGNRVNGKGQRAISIIPTYFYEFDSLDTRRDVTIAAYDVNATGHKVGQAIHQMTSGKFRRDWVSNPVLDPNDLVAYYGINWPIIRFSDVLLMFAEADNEINKGASAEAIAAFEEVRKRAFGSNASLIGVTPTGYRPFFEAIMKERSLEFGGEGIRKFDLIRWNEIGNKFAEVRDKLRKMVAKQAPYDKLPATVYYKLNSTDLVYHSSFYKPSPTTVPATATWRNASWVNATNISETYITGIAQSFRSNHSELLPLPLSVTVTNPNVKQDCGCDN